MTLLYRSPNVLVGEHEWHIIVRMTDHGVVVTEYKWRSVTELWGYWHGISEWPLTRFPHRLRNHFQAYSKSIKNAVASASRAPIMRRKAA